MTDTPALTKDDALAFMAKINAGREAIGLEPIAKIKREDYEAMSPGSSKECMSASLLFNVDGHGDVMTRHAQVPASMAPELCEALGTGQVEDHEPSHFGHGGELVLIPSEILTVTDVFDELAVPHNTAGDPVLMALQAADLIE